MPFVFCDIRRLLNQSTKFFVLSLNSPVYFYATFGLAQLNRLLISQQQ